MITWIVNNIMFIGLLVGLIGLLSVLAFMSYSVLGRHKRIFDFLRFSKKEGFEFYDGFVYEWWHNAEDPKLQQGLIREIGEESFVKFKQLHKLLNLNDKDSFLFSRGTNRSMANILHKFERDTEVFIFDYSFNSGAGEKRRMYEQTVFRFRSAKFNFPKFIMKPGIMKHKLASYFGVNDISYDKFPRFGKRYCLRGHKIDLIREMFSEELVRFILSNPGFTIEGEKNELFIYRHSEFSKTRHLKQLFNQSSWLLEKLLENLKKARAIENKINSAG